MRMVVAALVAAFVSTSAHALTYDVDLLLDDYTYENVDGQWVHTNGSDPISITGQVETDGTLGTLDSTNILSWSFTISSTSGSQEISSGATAGFTEVYGNFAATETELSVSEDRWGFIQFSGSEDSFVIGRLHGENGNTHTYAYFKDFELSCNEDVSACNIANVNSGNRGIERELQIIGTRDATAVAVVPLPGGLGLLGGALAMFAFFGFRRKPA